MFSKMFVTVAVLIGVVAVTNAGFLDGDVVSVGYTAPAVYTYRPFYQPLVSYNYRPAARYYYPTAAYYYRPYGYTYENNRVVVDGPGRRWERDVGQEGYF